MSFLIKQLLDWFHSGGGQLHPQVEIAHSEVDGYHLRAKALLDTSIPVVYCPRNLSLSVDNTQERYGWPQAFISRFEKKSPEVLVRFLLLEEYLKGSESKWWPYLATLPAPEHIAARSKLHTPLWFTEGEKDLLKGTNIAAAIGPRENLWREEFETGIALLGEYMAPKSPYWSG